MANDVYKGSNSQANLYQWKDNGYNINTRFVTEYDPALKKTFVYILGPELMGIGGGRGQPFATKDSGSSGYTVTSYTQNLPSGLKNLVKDPNWSKTMDAQTRYHVTRGVTFNGTVAQIPGQVDKILGVPSPNLAPTPPQADQQSGTTPADQQAGTTPPTGTTGTTTSLPQGTGTDLNAGWKEPTPGVTGVYTNYRYPFLISDEQDCIRFEIFGLKRNSLAKFEENVVADAFRKQTVFGVEGDSGGKSEMYKKIDNTPPIIIGIQGQIIDQNTVNWGAGELNELQRMGAELSAKTMISPKPVTDAFGDLLTGIKDAATKNSAQLQTLLYNAALEQAVGAPGLLSRITGGILNPNMELLFQGPQLRPFNFNFKMSPRSKDEADSVKRIIRAFKRNMAPRVNNLFLQSPNVFKITYIKGSKDTSETHQSINLIKMCSLQNCSVDYTPLQTYMTYDDKDDPQASMVSYNMSLSFSEITPIYQNDYDVEKHPIGF